MPYLRAVSAYQRGDSYLTPCGKHDLVGSHLHQRRTPYFILVHDPCVLPVLLPSSTTFLYPATIHPNHLRIHSLQCLVMRPTPAFEASSRPRKASNDHSRATAHPSTPTTFFLASEADLSRRGSTTSGPSSKDLSPVRTLKDTIDEANRVSPTRQSPHSRRDGSRRRSTIRPKSIEHLRPEGIRQHEVMKSSPTGLFTPVIASSQEPSLPGSPKSFSSRSLVKSDDELTQDGNSSQAIESGDDEPLEDASPSIQDSAPQLIMPSIRMPSRRPFTENGKQLGKFKILVAGSRGKSGPSRVDCVLTISRFWQILSDQIDCPSL